MTQAFNLSQLANNLNTAGQLDATDGLTGAVPVANGGTGLTSTPSNGQLDIGNGSGFTRATLTAGSNISITNGAGSITIASTAGAPTTAQVLSAIAGATAVTVGTYIVAISSVQVTVNSTTSASNLRTINVDNENVYTPITNYGYSGTFKLMFAYTSGNSSVLSRANENWTNLWLRIS